MFQRSVFRASRQASRRVSRFQPAQITAPVACRPLGAIRCYADGPAAASNGNGNGNGANKEGAANGAADETAKLKAELEKKDKEIIDLKVCPSTLHTLKTPH